MARPSNLVPLVRNGSRERRMYNPLLDVIHTSDSLLCICLVYISDKPKAPATAGVPIFDDNLTQTSLVLVPLVNKVEPTAPN